MLVINPMTSDTRVEKQARALVAHGDEVIVVATHADGLAPEELRDGYRILRLPYRRPLKDAFVLPFDRATARHRGRSDAAQVAQRGGISLGLRFPRLRGTAERAVTRLWLLFGGAILKAIRSRALTIDYWHGIGRRIPDHVERPDIITAHDLGPLQAAVRLADRWEATGSRPRVVYDSHELYVEQQTRWTRREKLAWKLHERRQIGRADLVTTVSPGIASELERRYRLTARPTLVLNSPVSPPTSADPAAADVRSDLGCQPGILAVYVGSVKPGRGVDLLIPALSAKDGWRLAIVGAGRNGYVQGLIEAATKLGVGGRVHLLDTRPAEELPTYLRTADVGVHPMEPSCLNHELALPNKLFDYLFAGLPVAVSALRQMRSLVDEHRLGTTFDPRDPSSAADAIITAADWPRPVASPPLLAELSWENQAAQLVEAYERLASLRQ